MENGYDYYLVRSNEDEENKLPEKGKTHMRLKLHDGHWWLFENTLK